MNEENEKLLNKYLKRQQWKAREKKVKLLFVLFVIGTIALFLIFYNR